MFLQSAISHEGAISREDVRPRQRNQLAALIDMSKNELARLDSRARTGRRLYPASFDLRLREPVSITEMIVRVVKRRKAVHIQRRKHFDAGRSCQERLVFSRGALALGRIAREQNDDSVQRRTGEAANPPVGMVPAGITKHFRARDHALPEFLRERRQRLFVYAKRAKSLPSKGNGDPPLFSFDGIPGLLNGGDLVENCCKPRPSLGRLAKRKELIPTRERGDTGYDDVLDIIELKHRSAPNARPMHSARQKFPVRRA
jgi:hypothetical protein